MRFPIFELASEREAAGLPNCNGSEPIRFVFISLPCDGLSVLRQLCRWDANNEGIWSDGTRLIVAGGHNARILIWNTFPTSNFAAADVVLGQSDFAHNAPNDDNQDGQTDAGPTARTLGFPYQIDSDGTQLFVTDSSNNRLVIWKTIPTTNFAPADIVLGQSDFAHYTQNDDNQDGSQDSQPSARTFYTPSGVYFHSGNLLVTDENNNRILVFAGLD